MKNKLLLFSALIAICLATACNEKHKNYGVERQDTINAGDTSNNIQNSLPGKDTVKK